MEEAGKGGGRKQHAIVTPGALVIALDEQIGREVHACLERSGEVKFSIQEVSVTSLNEVAEPIPVVVD